MRDFCFFARFEVLFETKIKFLTETIKLSISLLLKESIYSVLYFRNVEATGGGGGCIGMENKESTYIAIDLKSFYASVECIERGLDPMTTNLVVADSGRTEKTICLAVSPSLKAYGISGRARLFEAVVKVKEANALRLSTAPGHRFTGKSYDHALLKTSPQLAIDYIVAPPQMALYMEYSTRVYDIYLKYVAPEDIHVYSIDEVFIDVTDYLDTYQLTAREMTMMMIQDILKTVGVTATAGIGPNLYLAKIAMDIGAKRILPDKDGVRIAELNETSYRQLLWTHRPITDFWRVGQGYAKMETSTRRSDTTKALSYRLNSTKNSRSSTAD